MLLLFVIPVVAVIGFAVVALGSAVVGSQRARFEAGDGGLVLHGDLYGRTIPRAAIVESGVRVVDLAREPALRPIRRTLGTAIPGYRSGWFQLANGEKALLYVTDERRVVYVPTTAGYSLLLSPTDPEGLTGTLRGPPSAPPEEH
jgi:hypothetical protein